MTAALRFARSALSKRKISWGDWLAPALILVTSFVNFLSYHDYGLGRPESLLAIAVLLGVGLAASLIMTVQPKLRLPFLPWPLLLRPLVFAVAIFYFLDSQPELKRATVSFLSRTFYDGARCVPCIIIFFSIVLVSTYAISAALKKNAGTVFASIFGVALLAIIVIPRPQDARRVVTQTDFPTVAAVHADLPPVVHIVLDEQIGIAGLPEDVPGVAALRTELTDFYLNNGFRLYGRAFSRYRHTENSLSNLMNGITSPYDLSLISRSRIGYVLKENARFDQLAAQNYRIRVYQTDAVDFCASAGSGISSCTAYPGNSVGAFRDFDAKITSKTSALFKYFFYSTSTVGLANKLSNYGNAFFQNRGGLFKPARFMNEPPYLGAPWTKRAAERLIDDLRDAEPGTAYFAHLLIPHSGFILDENCRLKPDMDSWSPAQQGIGLRPNQRLSNSSRVARYVEYFKQVRCTHRLLGEMLEALSEAGVLEQATVIIHGDHGSRLSGLEPLKSNAARLTKADIMDSYSTLYAIRSPDVKAGYDPSVRSIYALFAEHAMGRPPGEEPATVFLTQEGNPSDRAGGRLVEYPFPGFD